MTTARNRATPFLVLDMATIRFQWNPEHTACSALTSRGELIAVVPVDPSTDQRQVVFRLLDHALDQGQVTRTDPHDPDRRVTYRIALYNPFTAEVAAEPVPRTVTFTDTEPVTLPAEGASASAVTSGRSPTLTLDDGRVLTPRTLTFAGLTRAQVAHQAA